VSHKTSWHPARYTNCVWNLCFANLLWNNKPYTSHTHNLVNKSRNKCPQIQHKKRMNFFIQNKFPLLNFQPKNYNKTFKQNNQKLVTQHSSSVDGMTFLLLVSYMDWCLSAQVLSCPKYNENSIDLLSKNPRCKNHGILVLYAINMNFQKHSNYFQFGKWNCRIKMKVLIIVWHCSRN